MSTFRSRDPNEDMTSYLKAKQAYEIQNTGSSGIDFGSTPAQSLASMVSPTTPIDYTLHIGESISAYNERIATARGETTSAPGYPTQAQVSAAATSPKVGDIAPGTNLKYEQVDLENLKTNVLPPTPPTSPSGTTNVLGLGAGSPPDTSKTNPVITTPSTINTAATATTAATENIQKKIDEKNKEDNDKLIADQKAEADRLKASMGTSATGYEGLVELAKTKPTLSTEAKLAEENAKAGTTALQAKLSAQNAKIVSIQSEIAQDEATRTAEVENARNRLSSMENISADINNINYK